MIRWYNNLSLRNKLWSVFLALIVLNLALAATALYNQRQGQSTVDHLLDVDVQVAKLGADSVRELLQARADERDYLLNYKSLGFAKARAQYADALHNGIATLHQRMADIRGLTAHKETIDKSQAVDKALSDFETSFNSTVALIEKRGFVDAGQEGVFRQVAHDVEATVVEQNLDLLTIDLLSIRRHEKDYLLRADDQYVTQVQDAVVKFKSDVKASSLSPEAKAKLTTQGDDYLTAFNQYVQLDKQVAASIAAYRASAQAAEPLVQQLDDQATADEIQARADLRQSGQVAMLTVFTVALAALLLGLASAYVFSRNLVRSVGAYALFAGQVAQGDLGVRLEANGRDELGALANHLNGMVAGLGDLSGQIRDSVQNINSASAEILATVSQHNASANEQSAAITETSATVEEVRASAEQAARKASDVAQLGQTSLRVNQEGAQAVKAIVEGMQDIRAKVQTIAQDILALSEQTQQIGEITSTVNDIADQSNLLALNAAIEAAKAGEQGKGFAVVANEVRNLAEQSKQATGKVRAILSDIQKATNAAVLATEQGTRGVENGMSLAQRAGDVIGQLSDTIRDAAQAAQQIAASAHQQSVAMDQIAQAIKEINTATTQFLAGARQSQTAAEGLTAMAHQLQLSTDRYKYHAN